MFNKKKKKINELNKENKELKKIIDEKKGLIIQQTFKIDNLNRELDELKSNLQKTQAEKKPKKTSKSKKEA